MNNLNEKGFFCFENIRCETAHMPHIKADRPQVTFFTFSLQPHVDYLSWLWRRNEDSTVLPNFMWRRHTVMSGSVPTSHDITTLKYCRLFRTHTHTAMHAAKLWSNESWSQDQHYSDIVWPNTPWHRSTNTKYRKINFFLLRWSLSVQFILH